MTETTPAFDEDEWYEDWLAGYNAFSDSVPYLRPPDVSSTWQEGWMQAKSDKETTDDAQ